MKKRRLHFHKLNRIIRRILAFIVTAGIFIYITKNNEVYSSANGEIVSFSNDAYAEAQWAINNPGYYVYLSEDGIYEKTSVEGIDMDVTEAWDSFVKADASQREVVIAVIDTGVDYTHPDLAENMWMNKGEIDKDGIDNDNNGYVDDIYGWDFYNDDASVCHYEYVEQYDNYLAYKKDNDDHGTHIAGIIGAVANNEIGVAGVASNIKVKIMALKINGGEKGTGNITGAIEAIKYATMMGADICNLSWGTTQYSEPLRKVMQESDMLFVAAAGNTGNNNDNKPIYPASFELDNLISVAFIDSAGNLNSLSNYGKNSVDLAAPGEDIYSTIVGSYQSMSGSSMAAPHISAVAGLLYASNDNLFAANIKEILIDNIKELPSLKDVVRNGGIPSAYKAIMAAVNLTPDTEVPSIQLETLYEEGKMIIPVYVEDQGSSNIRVVKWLLGEKTLQDFGRGTKGTTVVDNQLTITKAGIYTIYAADYAGNETVQTYEVIEDGAAPNLKVSYAVAGNYKSRTVTVKVSDKLSGIRRVEYMSGKKTAEEFLPAKVGKVIEINNGKGTFKVKKDGTYTVFVIDNRGNMKVKTIVVKTVKATEVKFARTYRTVTQGDEFNLKAFMKPYETTDKITYSSSDETIAVISSSGKVKALTKGKVTITAKTSSGLTAACIVTI